MGPARGGDLEATRGGAIAARGPSTLNYVPADAAGFEIVPEVVRARLRATGVIGVTALCASANSLQLRRRADGSHYQTGTAWWADTGRAVMLDVYREMEHRGTRQYSPIGAWRVSGTVHHLRDVGGAERSTWQHDASPKGGSSSPPVVSDDPLDLLPPDVAAPVRGGLSDAWRDISDVSITEYLTAIRVSDHEVLFLEANRTARSDGALSRAPWSVTTLMAPVTKRVPFSFTCDARAAVGGEEGRGAIGDRRPRLPGG